MPLDLDWSRVSVGSANLIMRKQVDWSLLESGWTIPVGLHDRVATLNGGTRLAPGEDHRVALIVHGHSYDAALTCVRRLSGPPHILQIRYDRNLELRALLVNVFWSSHSLLTVERHRLKASQPSGGRVLAEVPSHAAEFVEWKSTSVHFCYELSLLPCRVRMPNPVTSTLTRIGERFVEAMLAESSDDQFSFWLSNFRHLASPSGRDAAECLSHGRRYLRLAAELLSSLYSSSCQLCNTRTAIAPEIMVTSIHHLEPFVTSLDNRLSNLIVLCPTHHAILHRAGVQFNRESSSFMIPGSKPLCVALDHHLAS